MQKAKGRHVDDGHRTIHILKGYRLPLQKWNQIVLNMKAGTLDVFINGNLVMSGAEAVPNLAFDNLVVGQSNGVQGAVALGAAAARLERPLAANPLRPVAVHWR